MKTTLKVAAAAAAVSNEWMESPNEPITLTDFEWPSLQLMFQNRLLATYYYISDPQIQQIHGIQISVSI